MNSVCVKNIDSDWKKTKITVEEAGDNFLEISQDKIKIYVFKCVYK